ncbi:MAG TPA: methyl-accepting chemotaxis protein [Burkholderiaceae bacterium]
MRKNFPVTQNEFHMKDDMPIVSKTDLKGKITYVNPYFVEVSGFDESELIGAPHNIVRHPDMPPEAFEDLWQTLKAGFTWSAMVKNRRKNGDYYWVVANATPLLENGVPSGYLSVRTKPTRAEIDAAEKLYRSMREGKADVTIHRGQLIRKGWLGWLDRLRQLSMANTVVALIAVLVALLLAIVALAFAPVSANSTRIMGSLAGASLIWTLVVGYVLKRSVVIPLAIANGAARAMAGGDLTLEVDIGHGGEMGLLLRALHQTSVNLRSVIGDVGRNIETMNVATAEIATGNMDLSSRTEAQASSLEETAASMEELSSTVKQNTETSQKVQCLVTDSCELAASGSNVVARVGNTMNEITSSASKIKDIIGMIDGIAFQTNILALNAAVEAARAGEQGRGFAVVAGEVRNLAQRAASAAKDIKGLIDVSVANIDAGNSLVHDAEESMRAILDSVRRVETFAKDIATASNEQASGIEQVNQAVMQLEDTTQQNAAMVEQAAAAARQLNEQGAQVALAVSLFKTGKVSRVFENRDADQDAGQHGHMRQTNVPRVGSTRNVRLIRP